MTSADKFIMNYNYQQLVDQLVRNPNKGIATCYTPIKIKKLDSLVDSLLEQGWDAMYAISTNSAGREIVQIYYEYKNNNNIVINNI